MPSEEALLQQAEEWKTKGNDAFSKSAYTQAISAYSQGIVACDRVSTTTTTIHTLKATLLSNRAICFLKTMQFSACIEDCTTALTTLDCDSKLRTKLLFRRAKARFLLLNITHRDDDDNTTSTSTTTSSINDSLQEAAKDLLQVLALDPKNTEANQLLMTVRAQHKATTATTNNSPVAKTIAALQQHAIAAGSSSSSSGTDAKDTLHNIKLLLGMLDNDLSNVAMEMGRCGAVSTLITLASIATSNNNNNNKQQVLAVTCLSQMAAYPPACRQYLVPQQQEIANIITNTINAANTGDSLHNDTDTDNDTDLIVSVLAVLVRILLHADRDGSEDQEITGKTLVNHHVILQACAQAMLFATPPPNDQNNNNHNYKNKNIIRAVLDVWSTWTAGPDREAMIRAALASSSSAGHSHDPDLAVPKTPAEVRSMSPQELARYRKREYDKRTRDEAWAYERAMLFCADRQRGLNVLLTTACACQDHIVRREMIVVLGRMLAGMQEEDKIKEAVKAFLAKEEETSKHQGVIIEEVYNQDGEEEEEKDIEEVDDVVSLETKMERAIITSALLLSKKEVGAWALGTGWKDSDIELPDLIHSGDKRAMCLASEVISGAATVESARHRVAALVSSGAMEKLMMSDDRDIRSGAASAVTKLGLADKATDEGEVMGLLQGACDLLEDNEPESASSTAAPSSHKTSDKLRHFSSFATSSVERGVEMMTYLVANTTVKEELAAGFQSSPRAPHTALENLVKIADLPNAGESLTGFGLATIFQNLAVTNLQLRKEGFEGKEVTMEQYDEMQRMGKTDEEKEMMDAEKDTDTQEGCNERIRKMASANVPRALVALVEGASEHTLEQIVLAMNRMAGEPSVRGIMIQQGVLSSCIKVEKNEGPTDTDTMKKVFRLARHCIAKILITTNPSLLTSAQRLGSIKPLIQLVRDIKASDLQHFEALLALTNIASSGDDAKNRIVSERGIPSLHFAMFSDHEMVRRAATEALCNMVPHKAMMDHLTNSENLKLWLAFATDYEDNYECARAASGCLAMATQDESIALELVQLEKFESSINSLLECGRLEIMHRVLVLILNLVAYEGDIRQKAIQAGLVAFCRAYVDSFHDKKEDFELTPEESSLLPITVDLAKKIYKMGGEE